MIDFDVGFNRLKIQPMKAVSRFHSQKPKVNRHSQLIPIRPVNYFAKACSKAEIREENRLAKTSVIHAPEDLE